MANKIQTYTIVFNTAQPDVETAMQSIGSALSTEIIELISQGLLLFNIIDDDQTLSEDGLTLNVQRTWKEEVYNTLIGHASIDTIRTTINNLSHVSSVTYDFSDA